MTPTRITFELSEFQLDVFFKPIRSKLDQIITLLEAMRYMLIYTDGLVTNSKAEITVDPILSNRLFFISESKIYSLYIPVKIFKAGDEVRLYYGHTKLPVSSKLIAGAMQYFQNLHTPNLTIWDTLDPLDELDESDDVWLFCQHLLTHETAYLRFDHDQKNENGIMHPLNHFDIFSSQGISFKVGVESKLSLDRFIDILNKKTNSFYLVEKNETIISKIKKLL